MREGVIAAKPAPTRGEKPYRPGFAASVETLDKALPRLRRKLKAAGIPHVAVVETGYLKSGHKHRELPGRRRAPSHHFTLP